MTDEVLVEFRLSFKWHRVLFSVRPRLLLLYWWGGWVIWNYFADQLQIVRVPASQTQPFNFEFVLRVLRTLIVFLSSCFCWSFSYYLVKNGFETGAMQISKLRNKVCGIPRLINLRFFVGVKKCNATFWKKKSSDFCAKSSSLLVLKERNSNLLPALVSLFQ